MAARPSAPAHFAGAPRPGGSRTISLPRNLQGARIGVNRRRPPYTGPYGYRRPYAPIYGVGLPYGYGGAPYFLSYPYDFGDDSAEAQPDAGYDEQAAGPDPNDLGPAGQAPYDQGSYGPGPMRPEYGAAQTTAPQLPPWPGIAPNPAPAASKPEPREAVTLIFKDGRPPEQIRNYILTKDTLYVDGRHPAIPVDQIDVAATAKVNHDAGVDFHLPGPSR